MAGPNRGKFNNLCHTFVGFKHNKNINFASCGWLGIGPFLFLMPVVLAANCPFEVIKNLLF